MEEHGVSEDKGNEVMESLVIPACTQMARHADFYILV